MDKRFEHQHRYTPDDVTSFEIETPREVLAYAKACHDMERSLGAELHSSTCMNKIERAHLLPDEVRE